MPTYSYNPTEIENEGVSKMRFELGDTTFAPGELTAALCDEEYAAVIGKASSWKRAKLKCLKAILMKYAHQTTVKVGPVSYDFSDRVKFWKGLYDELKGTLQGASFPPSIGSDDGNGKPYFYEDMHANPRKG